MAEKRQLDTLQFTLDSKSGVPFYKQIILQIEIAIADGRLPPGARLPTVRSLAVDLQVNPNTVARAYSELEIRQILETQQGTGTFIGDRAVKLSDVERERVLSELVREFVAKVSSYGFTVREIAQYMNDVVGQEESDEARA
jgi:GntR family transcriptional regulator